MSSVLLNSAKKYCVEHFFLLSTVSFRKHFVLW